nr:unnamed protein product [Spirometra erinaceieuropaei]
MEVTHITTTRSVTYTIFKKVTTTVKQPAIVSVADLGCTESQPTFHEIVYSLDIRSQKFRLDQVVLFGEGLAANLLARVAILDDIRVLGAVLLHCRGVFSGPLATMKDKMQQWRARKLPTDAYTEKQFIDHRFGCINSDSVTETLKDALGKFKRRLHSDLNMQNLKCLSVAYEQRASLLEQLSGLSCPTLFIAGKNFLYVNGQRTLVEALKKPQQQNSNRRIESIEYEGTVNPMIEKPEKVAENLRLFLQGLGLECPCHRPAEEYGQNNGPLYPQFRVEVAATGLDGALQPV